MLSETLRRMGIGLMLGALAGSAGLAQGNPLDGTGLEMRAVTVRDQNQLRGRFGDKWQADEVRTRAAQVCEEAGMRLVYFQPGNTLSTGWTEFTAVCQ